MGVEPVAVPFRGFVVVEGDPARVPGPEVEGPPATGVVTDGVDGPAGVDPEAGVGNAFATTTAFGFAVSGGTFIARKA